MLAPNCLLAPAYLDQPKATTVPFEVAEGCAGLWVEAVLTDINELEGECIASTTQESTVTTPSIITLDTTVAQAEKLVSADIGAEVVMLHIENNAYYDTDPIGTDIWHRLAQPTTVKTLCTALVQVYDVDVETCQADVLAFLNEAYKEGVVCIVTP